MKAARQKVGSRHLLTVEIMADSQGEVLPRQIETMLAQVNALARKEDLKIDWSTFRLEVKPPDNDPFAVRDRLLETRLLVMAD